MTFFSSMIVTTILTIHTNRSSFSVVRLYRALQCLRFAISFLTAFGMTILCVGSATAQPTEKCGTPAHIDELLRVKSDPHKAHSILFIPPTGLPESIISPSGRFTIHYTKVGDSSATKEFVDEVARLADEAYEFEVVKLGYPKPAFSFADSTWHIYLRDFNSGVYGATSQTEAGSFSTSTSGLQRFRSFIEMDNDYPANHYATYGLDAVQITVFHEFHHLIQHADYGVDLSSKSGITSLFQEMTSTWMEVRSTPDVIDYTYYMPSYFKNIHQTLPLATTDLGYSEAIWLYYLAKQFGDEIIKQVWERLSNIDNDVLLAFDKVLNTYNTDFCTEYKRFGAELVLTGRRTKRGSIFADANLFPIDQLKINRLTIGVPKELLAINPASLNYFAAGFAKDTGFMVVARNTDRSFAPNAKFKFTSLSTYENDYSGDDSTFCDTIFVFTPTDAMVFPQPCLLTDDPKRPPQLFISTSNSGKKPVSPTDLRVYSIDMTLIRHISKSAEPFGGGWYMAWDGTDDVGKLVPSGVYFYSILVDGENKNGKMVVVRK